MNRVKLLKELTLLDAAPGYEREVRNYMRKAMEKSGCEIIQDGLGSIFAVKKSKTKNAPKVMFAGHMDEVAFMITGYTKHGLLKFVPLGGWWNQTMLAQRVTITNANGKKLPGVISSIAPHLLTPELLKKPFEIKSMMIDCGFEDEADAKKHVEIGAFVTPRVEFEELGKHRLLSKAFDNRYGCAIALEILNELKDVELDVDLYIGATVQEETGLRGATTAANLINPDFFIAVDSSPARDTSGDMEELGRLGKGFLVRIHDRTMILNQNVKNFAIENAQAVKANYQFYTSPGGTDAGAVHISNQGVLSIVLGIPSRNIHTHSSIMDLRDYDAAYKTAISMLKNLNAKQIEELKNA